MYGEENVSLTRWNKEAQKLFELLGQKWNQTDSKDLWRANLKFFQEKQKRFTDAELKLKELEQKKDGQDLEKA